MGGNNLTIGKLDPCGRTLGHYDGLLKRCPEAEGLREATSAPAAAQAGALFWGPALQAVGLLLALCPDAVGDTHPDLPCPSSGTQAQLACKVLSG